MTERNLGADPFAGTPLIPHNEFENLTLTQDSRNPRVARITFNRPNKLNAITFTTPGEIRRAVEAANAIDEIHVIVLQGAGPAFCAGYDLGCLRSERKTTPASKNLIPGTPWSITARCEPIRTIL